MRRIEEDFVMMELQALVRGHSRPRQLRQQRQQQPPPPPQAGPFLTEWRNTGSSNFAGHRGKAPAAMIQSV
jgi:hypothetical protein